MTVVETQARVTALFKLMFWSFVALVAFVWVTYTLYPTHAPVHRNQMYLMALGALAAMAFIWRVLLLRRQLSLRTLHRIDLVYSLGIGCAFGIGAYLQRDLRASGYLALVYATFTVFARALIMPSSWRRTAVASVMTAIPMVIATIALAFEVDEDLPPGAFVVTSTLFMIVPLVISTAGSHIIYGLRRQVSEAQQLGAYKLDRKIGEGGNGSVHLAHHVLLRRPTAIKLVLPERVKPATLERFEREVQHMSQLTHPNTVAVYDYGRSPDGLFYYAMEYLGGGIDLEHLVAKHGPQPSGRVAHILAQVCGALHEAHGKHIIHRDIKPANIILCERGGMADVAKVVDYGLVKELAVDTGISTQVIVGTPAYLAPEAVTDPGSVGLAADLYALGAVGYFLLTGKRVFEGKPIDVCVAHVSRPVPPPSTIVPVAPALEAVIMKCLAKQPRDRYASARELSAALPAVDDWDQAAARRWWQDFRKAEQTLMAVAQMPTITISVDLGEREHRVNAATVLDSSATP